MAASENSIEIPSRADDFDSTKSYRDFLWQEPGFHRTLGSVWFNYLPFCGISFISIFYFVIIMPTYIPTETLGTNTVFTQILGFSGVLAELGLSDAIQRFISEKRITQPQYTIYYLQFFILFKLFSGLLMVTGIAIWTFIFVPQTALAYSMWYYLIYSFLQYPGWFNVYNASLSGYQQFNKTNYIALAGQGVNLLTEYFCVILGTYLGNMDPSFGGTMGATIGFVVGNYLSQLFMFLLGAYFFRTVIHEINPTWGLGKTFHWEFDGKIAKECLHFGIGSMISTFLDTGLKMAITYLAIAWLPDYATVFGAIAVTSIVVANISLNIPITPIVSEAFNNGKIDLTEFYIGHGLKYCGVFAAMFSSTIFAIAPLFLSRAGSSYALAAIYLPYMAVVQILAAFTSFLENASTGCNRPYYRFYYYLIEDLTYIGLMYVFIQIFHLLWIGYLLAQISSLIVKNIFGWTLFSKKIMHPYISVMQTIILPLIAGLAQYGVLVALNVTTFAAIASILTPVPTISIYMLIGFTVTPLLIFWPVYTILGGWDPVGLDIMNEATEVSEISKPIVKLFNYITQHLAKKSPFYNKFRIHFRSAQFELDELRVMMGRKPKESLHVRDIP